MDMKEDQEATQIHKIQMLISVTHPLRLDGFSLSSQSSIGVAEIAVDARNLQTQQKPCDLFSQEFRKVLQLFVS